MRLRHIPGSEEAIALSPYVVQEPEKQKGCWHNLFGNANPIAIEVGMGKGRFIMELAKENPDWNYIGIERYSSVLLRGAGEEEGTGTDQYLVFMYRREKSGGQLCGRRSKKDLLKLFRSVAQGQTCKAPSDLTGFFKGL